MLTPQSRVGALTDDPETKLLLGNVGHGPACLLLPTHTFFPLLIITRETMKANVQQSAA